jgi:hypothetical protein
MTTRRTIEDPSAKRLGTRKPAAQRRGPPVVPKPPARRRPTVTSKADVKAGLKAGAKKIGRGVKKVGRGYVGVTEGAARLGRRAVHAGATKIATATAPSRKARIREEPVSDPMSRAVRRPQFTTRRRGRGR